MDMDGVLCWYAGGGACMDAYEMVAIGSRQSFGCAVGLRYPDDDKRTSLAVSLVGDELSFFVLFCDAESLACPPSIGSTLSYRGLSVPPVKDPNGSSSLMDG